MLLGVIVYEQQYFSTNLRSNILELQLDVATLELLDYKPFDACMLGWLYGTKYNNNDRSIVIIPPECIHRLHNTLLQLLW